MPSRSPSISVVIPTKNRHSMLAEAIASVLRQDFDDYEIVVIDDGVGAAEFIADWFGAEGCVRCADNAESGQVRARNLGVSLARGEIVAFLDDDDCWGAKSYLSAVRAAIDGRQAATLASGDIVVVGDDMSVVETIPFAASTSPEAIRCDNKILVSGFAFSRALSGRLGPFDETLPIYWDWDWYLRLHAAGVPFHDLGKQAVTIAAHRRATSGDGHANVRADNLALLSAKYGLGPLALRNHESIARDAAAGR
ncbi:MAG: glycosyltransferase family 2 protein [Roseiarcus sp.]|jgi:glycosyltransferase involved in cell wall biosynthesis